MCGALDGRQAAAAKQRFDRPGESWGMKGIKCLPTSLYLTAVPVVFYHFIWYVGAWQTAVDGLVGSVALLLYKM